MQDKLAIGEQISITLNGKPVNTTPPKPNTIHIVEKKDNITPKKK